MAPSRITCHHALDDIISRAFASAKIPVTKEPSGLFRSNGKRPNGLTLISWQRYLSLTRDVAFATTLADSLHFSICIISWRRSRDGDVQETSQLRRVLSGLYMFQSIALKILGPIYESASQFLNDFGHIITSVSADDKE